MAWTTLGRTTPTWSARVRTGWRAKFPGSRPADRFRARHALHPRLPAHQTKPARNPRGTRLPPHPLTHHHSIRCSSIKNPNQSIHPFVVPVPPASFSYLRPWPCSPASIFVRRPPSASAARLLTRMRPRKTSRCLVETSPSPSPTCRQGPTRWKSMPPNSTKTPPAAA